MKGGDCSLQNHSISNYLSIYLFTYFFSFFLGGGNKQRTRTKTHPHEIKVTLRFYKLILLDFVLNFALPFIV